LIPTLLADRRKVQMRTIPAMLVLVLSLEWAVAASAQRGVHPPPQFTQRVQREVTHRILMLPYYGAFDVIGFKVEGYNLILVGKVTRPSLKDDAGHAMKGIEGIEKIDNQIEVLPVSFFDDDIRRRTFRAIYGYPALLRYALPPIKPIRIIVEHGNVTLEGVVDSSGDRNIAYLRANGVTGVFSVTNHLSVESDKSARKQK
jgi:hyperosmotically inducible protein